MSGKTAKAVRKARLTMFESYCKQGVRPEQALFMCRMSVKDAVRIIKKAGIKLHEENKNHS